MSESLHLLEVEVMWPPEPFLCRRLESLAERGIRVTVATRVTRRDAAGVRLHGVELKRIPPRGGSLIQVLPRVVVDSFALAVRDRALLRALIRAVLRELPPGLPAARCRHMLARLHAFVSIARLDADVVHFEWNDRAVDYLPLIRAWKRPVVISCRGSAVNVRPLLPADGLLARGLPESFEVAAAVHCVSDAMMRQAERYGLDRTKARIIRPAVDTAFFVPPPGEAPTTEGFRIAAVGLLRWQKGYEYALLAVRHLVDRGVPVQFEILGPEPPLALDEVSDRDRLVHGVADLGLDNHVRLLGGAPPNNVRELLHRAHALLHPSVIEGLPNVVLEAMACGLPVVVTDAGGTREAVRNGVEGFVVAPRDPRALAVALETLWRNESLRRRLGRAGRRRIEAEFTLDQQTQEFEALYREVVGRARGHKAHPRDPKAAAHGVPT